VNDPLVNTYLSGIVTVGLVAAGVYFARFWSRSRDMLFLAFTGAFWLLALSEALVTLGREPSGGGLSWYYLLRVPAFLLIAAAIVHKNATGDDED
jgi:Family of unknown function (DUF5985)